MQSDLELVKVVDSNTVLLRTTSMLTVFDFYVGKRFLSYNLKMYYCERYLEADSGYIYMRMSTGE